MIPYSCSSTTARAISTNEASNSGVGVTDANGASFADYDNDGDPDLLLVRDGSDLLFANDGTGHFTDVSAKAGIGDDNARGMDAAWGDFDGDGHLDVYVTNYMQCTGDWKTAGEIVSQVAYYDDTLYHNNGDGTFSDVTDLLEHDPDDPRRRRHDRRRLRRRVVRLQRRRPPRSVPRQRLRRSARPTTTACGATTAHRLPDGRSPTCLSTPAQRCS